MKFENYFYNFSEEYLDSISQNLYKEVMSVVSKLPKRDTQSQINNDLFWLFTDKGWTFDTLASISEAPPSELIVNQNRKDFFKKNNNRNLCCTIKNIGATWHCDFAKEFNSKLVQIEAQFGKVESMFKDFCGFEMARKEEKLALGIEIVLHEPYKYFSHRKKSISGMAYFEIAKKVLPILGFDCPIWLIGIKA